MASIEKKVSSAAILAKINRLKPGDSNWQADAMENIGDAIQAIGYHCGFEEKATPYNVPVEVVGHRAELPCDYERVLFVEELLASPTSTNAMDAEGNNITTDETDTCLKGYWLPRGTDRGLKSLAHKDAKRTIAVTPTTNYYNLQGDWIVTGFETCKIRIHYMGYPVDSEGLPLIVDDFDYKTCVYWYVISNMILAGYKFNELNWQIANAQFEKYLPKAQNSVKMLTLDQMEAFANMWLRYTGRRNQMDNFGVNYEQRELIDF